MLATFTPPKTNQAPWEQSIDRSETERYPVSGRPPPGGMVSAVAPCSVRGQPSTDPQVRGGTERKTVPSGNRRAVTSPAHCRNSVTVAGPGMNSGMIITTP